ncbi:spermidine synthase-like [Diadema setosum]|uniref:spermidine synthase-like n=1 Tax=Diadema setosum TaxID=31175 RepID=UPI003B3B62A1
MDAFKEGWFSELSPMWPGEAASLEVEEVLFHERSKYQDVLVFKSKTYGNVLVLDGAIQCTERDEFSYQEMLAFLPLNSHPNPKKVLVVGGGDGGVIREVVKHPAVESVTQCEIDGKVIEVCKKYLPCMAVGYSSPKLHQHIGDGFAFMKQNKGAFDVIITDSSDPIGPAKMLFEQEYYELMRSSLKPGGIIGTQGESPWLHLSLIKTMQTFCRTLFPVVDYAVTSIPTYPSGCIGFTLCSMSPETSFRDPIFKLTSEQVKEMGLRYYNADIHRASFVLPQFAKEALEETVVENGDKTE